MPCMSFEKALELMPRATMALGRERDTQAAEEEVTGATLRRAIIEDAEKREAAAENMAARSDAAMRQND